MADVTYNQQCLMIDGRRFWVIGAGLDYARIPAELWADRIAAAKQAGFNTIDTACVWSVHEPRDGKFRFDGQADVKRFIRMCGDAGLRVILRPGPFVGSGYDGGGIPGWIMGLDDVAIRESNEAFLEKVGRYFRKLMAEVSDLQATSGGPIIAVQVEHRWVSSNEQQAQAYLGELIRFMRERGIAVPMTNANELWQEVPGTIDTWRGWDDLLAHLRQLRTVNPDMPLLVSAFEASTMPVWGQKTVEQRSAMQTLWHMAETLAAGSQLVVQPFHGGTNFDFLGGQLPGAEGGGVITSAAADGPLGEAGQRDAKFDAVKRIATFASHFGHVFAELDPDHRPVAQDLAELEDRALHSTRGNNRSGARAPAVSIVAQRSARGRVIFAFSDGETDSTTLLLDNGLRMPVHFGDQPARWYLFDADLAGAGRLDYANVSPLAVINRSVIVFFGPAKSAALLSINGSPIEATVPAGREPLALAHKNLTVVILSDEQADSAYVTDDALYVGIAGLDQQGNPLRRRGVGKAFRIGADGAMSDVELEPATGGNGKGRKTITPSDWQIATADDRVNGDSPRYASLSGPETLTACGAPTGYGWYRIELDIPSARKLTCVLPGAADRVHVYVDGRLDRIIGSGPGADGGPFDVKLNKGTHLIAALVDNQGRFSDGGELAHFKGVFDHLYALKQLRTNKPKAIDAEPVDPFELRQYIAMRAKGQMSQPKQVLWSFKHLKKSPVLLHASRLPVSGTFVLNDVPVHYHSGDFGYPRLMLMLDPSRLEAFKRGKNDLRFAPDVGESMTPSKLISAIDLFECADNLSEKAKWAFAKWETPKASMYEPHERSTRSRHGVPVWWKARFDAPDLDVPLWLDVNGMSKGQAYVNGHNIGRYFTSTATGKAVGPQRRLYLPEPWLHVDKPNEIVLFDEHGFDPAKVRIARRFEP